MGRELKGGEDPIKGKLPVKEKGRRVEELIEGTCKKENISIQNYATVAGEEGYR